jgi:hypothetical protein
MHFYVCKILSLQKAGVKQGMAVGLGPMWTSPLEINSNKKPFYTEMPLPWIDWFL